MTAIEMPTTTLRRTLDVLGKVVNVREQTPLLRHIILDVEGATVTARAASTSWSGCAHVGTLGQLGIDGSEGRFALPYIELAAIAEVPPADKVTLTNERATLLVESGSAHWMFARPQSVDSFPATAGAIEEGIEPIAIQPAQLASALASVLYAMDANASQWSLVELKGGRVAAGGWHRAHVVQNGVGIPSTLDVVLPGPIVAPLVKLLTYAATVEATCWIIPAERAICIDLGIVGTFRAPAITSKVNSPLAMFFENPPAATATTDVAKLALAIRRSLIGGTAPRTASIQADKNGLTVASECGKETVDADVAHDLVGLVDGDYLLEAANSLVSTRAQVGADDRFVTLSDGSDATAVIYKQRPAE